MLTQFCSSECYRFWHCIILPVSLLSISTTKKRLIIEKMCSLKPSRTKVNGVDRQMTQNYFSYFNARNFDCTTREKERLGSRQFWHVTKLSLEKRCSSFLVNTSAEVGFLHPRKVFSPEPCVWIKPSTPLWSVLCLKATPR